jgi:REP element-mobilizing transposase RayT
MMPRRLRHGLQGTAFHVMNRAVRRTVLFEIARDYDAFLNVVGEGLWKFKVKVVAYQVMPNHWHFVVICDRIEEGGARATRAIAPARLPVRRTKRVEERSRAGRRAVAVG